MPQHHYGSQEPEQGSGQIRTGGVTTVSDLTRDYGMESLSQKSFFDADGKPLPLRDIVDLIMKHKPDANRGDVERQVLDFMPKLQQISQKEKGFLGTEKDIKGQERGLAMGKAEDVYGLGVSAAERERGGIEETYQLGARAAQRGLQSSLGQAQKQASSLGGQMRGAYGGSAMGMRGAIGGQASLAKGVESTYGGYADKQTALAGARGRGLGAVEDRMTQLGQERGYAETQYGVGGIGEQRAELGYEKGMYGLEQEKAGEFEQDFSQFFSTIEEIPEAREGGRVPSKESFSYLLQNLPEAGGS